VKSFCEITAGSGAAERARRASPRRTRGLREESEGSESARGSCDPRRGIAPSPLGSVTPGSSFKTFLTKEQIIFSKDLLVRVFSSNMYILSWTLGLILKCYFRFSKKNIHIRTYVCAY